MANTVKRWHREFDTVVTTVSAILTTVGEYPVGDMDGVGFHISNAGVLIDQFVIQAQFYDAGPWETMFSAAGDYTSPLGILIGTSGDLTGIADAATGWFIIYPKGIYKLRLRAASSGADTSITINGGGS